MNTQIWVFYQFSVFRNCKKNCVGYLISRLKIDFLLNNSKQYFIVLIISNIFSLLTYKRGYNKTSLQEKKKKKKI